MPPRYGTLVLVHGGVWENIPPNQVLGVVSYSNVIGEIEAVLPVDYLAVYIPSVFGAKWGPADETLKHDCAERPLFSGRLEF
jgi:hypothetical protein